MFSRFAAPDRGLSLTARKLSATRIIIWILLVAALIGGGVSAASSTTSEVPATSYASSSNVAADTTTLAANETKDVSSLSDTYFQTNAEGEKTKATKDVAGLKNPKDLLPAWRWTNPEGFVTNLDWKAFLDSASNFMAGLAFNAAGFMWQIILGLVSFALTADLVNNTAQVMNDGFTKIFESLGSSGIIFIILALAFFGVASALWKGKGQNAIRIAAVVLIPIGLLQSVATASSGAGDSIPVGSVGWIATTGNSFIGDVATSVGTGFGVLSTNGSSYNPEAQRRQLSCTKYVNTLYDAYYTFSSSRAEGSDGKSLANVSYLWERAYYDNWVRANSGSSESSWAIGCHAIEDASNVSVVEQARVGNIAYGGVGADNPFARDERGGGKSRVSGLLYWGACSAPGEVANAGWGSEAAGVTTDTCKNWWAGKGQSSKLEWGSPNDAKTAMDGALVKAGSAEQRRQIEEARDTTVSQMGGNGGSRIIAGGLALLVGGVFLYALGGLAIGGIVAQLGLVLLLVFLPVTLVLLAVGAKKGEMSPMGKKLVRMTIGFAALKAFITFIIVLLTQIIMLFQSLVGNFAGMPAFMAAILNGVIPLAAILILRKVLKAMGVGDILKPTGSIGAALSTANGLGAGSKGNFFNKAAASKTSSALSGSKLGSSADTMSGKLARKTGSAALKSPKAAKAGALGLGGLLTKNGRADLRSSVSERVKDTKNSLSNAKTSVQSSVRDRVMGAANADGVIEHPGAVHRLAGIPLVGSAIGRAAAGTRLGEAINSARADNEGFYKKAEHIRASKEEVGALRRSADQESRKEALMSRQERVMAHNERMESASYNGMVNAANLAGLDLLTTTDEATGAVSYVRDANGNLQHIDRATGAVKPITSDLIGRERLASQWAEANGVHDAHAGITTKGAAIFLPPSKGGQAEAIRTQKTEEGKILAAKSFTSYLPEEVHVQASTLPEGARADFYHNIGVATGVITPSGEPIDIASVHGVNLSTVAGMAELERVERGEPSRLDDIKIRISAGALASAAASAKISYGKTNSEVKKAETRTQIHVEAIQAAQTATKVAEDSKSSVHDAIERSVKLIEAKSTVADAAKTNPIFAKLNPTNLGESAVEINRIAARTQSAHEAAQADRYAQEQRAGKSEVIAKTASESLANLRTQLAAAVQRRNALPSGSPEYASIAAGVTALEGSVAQTTTTLQAASAEYGEATAALRNYDNIAKQMADVSKLREVITTNANEGPLNVQELNKSLRAALTGLRNVQEAHATSAGIDNLAKGGLSNEAKLRVARDIEQGESARREEMAKLQKHCEDLIESAHRAEVENNKKDAEHARKELDKSLRQIEERSEKMREDVETRKARAEDAMSVATRKAEASADFKTRSSRARDKVPANRPERLPRGEDE